MQAREALRLLDPHRTIIGYGGHKSFSFLNFLLANVLMHCNEPRCGDWTLYDHRTRVVPTLMSIVVSLDHIRDTYGTRVQIKR